MMSMELLFCLLYNFTKDDRYYSVIISMDELLKNYNKLRKNKWIRIMDKKQFWIGSKEK